MEKPWYMYEYEHKPYLHNKTLRYMVYPDTGIRGDHDHCEVCWTRFSIYEGDEHSGFYEEDRCRWICKECYNDFKDLFGWKLENPEAYHEVSNNDPTVDQQL